MENKYSVRLQGEEIVSTDSFAHAVLVAKANEANVFDNEAHRWVYDGYRDILAV